MLILFSTLARADNGGSSKGPFLKLGEYYVLYLYPSAPKLEGDSLMVPLRTTAELLGMRVTYYPETLSVLVSYSERSLRFEIGTAIAWVDGQALTLDTSPYILPRYDVMMVPLAPLLEVFDIAWTWSTGKTIFTVFTPPRANKTAPDTSPSQCRYPCQFSTIFPTIEIYPSTEKLIPTFFTWHWDSETIFEGVLKPNVFTFDESNFKLELVLIDPAAKEKQFDVSFVQTHFGYFTGAYGEGAFAPKGRSPSRCHWEIPNTTFTCAYQVSSSGNPVKYLLARVWESPYKPTDPSSP